MVSISISLPEIQSFLLIFLRVGAILFSAPIFDSNSAPMLFKLGLVLSISFLLSPLLNLNVVAFEAPFISLALMIASEIAVGLLIGFAVRTFFIGIQLAGQIAGFQMGLSIANVIDPASSMQVPIIGQFFNLFAMLIFLVSNAHHWFVKAIVESFYLVPPLAFNVNDALVSPILTLAGNIFVVAIKVSAPIVVSLFATSVALGIVARTVPQMNIFVVAMPLKILVGLFFLSLTLPFLAAFLADLFSGLGFQILGLIKLVS